MNKYVKLLLLFVSIIGVIVAVQYISSLIIHPVPDSDINVQSTVETLSNQIHEEWNKQTAWNKQVFEKHLDLLDENKRMGYIKKTEHDMLVESVCFEAISKTYYAMTEEWAKESCRPEFIRDQYSGVKEIKGREYVKGDKQIKELSALKKEYDNINSFIDGTLKKRTMGAKADVDKEYRWNDFEGIAKTVREKSSEFQSGRGYKTYFKNIEEVKKYLSNTESLIKDAADEYYQDVVGLLEASFDADLAKAVSESDSLAVVDLKKNMTRIVSKLKVECVGFSSSSYNHFQDYVNKKKYEE